MNVVSLSSVHVGHEKKFYIILNIPRIRKQIVI